MNQVCRKCSIDKPIEDYQFHRVSGKYYQTCRKCRQAVQYEWGKNNRDKQNATQRKWRKNNPDREWAVTNPEAYKASIAKAQKAWHERNPNYSHEYYLKNKAKYASNRANRRAAQKQATPSWLTAIQRNQIQEFYEISKAKQMQTGIEYHVDHIVPINGKVVLGLHAPWNLQLLTAEENLKKSWRVE
jgi:hypothetical protein